MRRPLASLLFAYVSALATACSPVPQPAVPKFDPGAQPSAANTAPTPGPPSSLTPTFTPPLTETAAATASAPPSSSASPSAPPSEPPPPPAAFTSALDAARTALASRDFHAADAQLAIAATAAGDDPHLVYLVAYHRAARFASAGDFDRAGASFLAVLPTLAKHPELADEFWTHNAMMMVREAQGDPAAALAENDQATLCAARGTWEPEERDKLAFQKDRWHRAYLTRMLAESRTGSVKQALVQYAQAALDEYRARSGFADSIAVLEAYFAALDGRKNDAVAAAKRVDPEKDDDVEDLYLVTVGLDAGGDHAAAEAVKRVMRRTSGVRIARAIMLHWLDLDAKKKGFTPRHSGQR